MRLLNRREFNGLCVALGSFASPTGAAGLDAAAGAASTGAARTAKFRDGNPHDFTASAGLAGAETIDLVGQGQFDAVLSTAHLGILNSPDTRNAALRFLTSLRGRADQEGED